MRSPGAGRLVAAAGTVGILAVAGCGAAGAAPAPATEAGIDTPSAAALQTVRSAVAHALTRTAQASVAFEGATAFGSAKSAVASGVFDVGAGTGTATLAFSGSGSAEAIVYTAAAVYVRPPSGSVALPPGRSWMAAVFADGTELARNFPQFISQVESANPALALSELSWGATSASAAGTDTVRGERELRYDVVVDLRRALTGAGGAARAPVALALQAEVTATLGAEGTGRAVVVAHVFIAADGRLLRVQVTPPGAGVGTVDVDLGADAPAPHVAAPSAQQVVDVGSVGPSGEREGRNGGDSDGA